MIRHLHRSIAVAVVLACSVVAAATGAAAQSADRIAANLADGGVYHESGADGTEAEMRAAVTQLASEGIEVAAASLSGEVSDLEGLAEELRDKTGLTVIVLTNDSVAAASPSHSAAEIDRALREVGTDVGDGILAFGRSLGPTPGFQPTGGDSTTAPTTTSATEVDTGGSSTGGEDNGATSGGGGGGVLIFFGVIIAVIVGLWLFTRSRNKRKVEAQLSERRATVTQELEEIGADIVAIADEVTFADNDEATEHFRAGNDQFLMLQDQLAAATSLWEVTQVDYGADTAAWHLDAAEAIISGEDVPPEPERPDLTTSRPPADGELGRESERTPPPDERAERSEPRSRADERERVDSRLEDRRRGRRVEPRRQRRQKWDAPKTRGGGLGDVMTKILVGGVLRGGGNGRKPPRRWNGAGDLGPSVGNLGTQPRGGSASRSRSRSGGSASRSRSGSSGGSASRRRGS